MMVDVYIVYVVNIDLKVCLKIFIYNGCLWFIEL